MRYTGQTAMEKLKRELQNEQRRLCASPFRAATLLACLVVMDCILLYALHCQHQAYF